MPIIRIEALQNNKACDSACTALMALFPDGNLPAVASEAQVYVDNRIPVSWLTAFLPQEEVVQLVKKWLWDISPDSDTQTQVEGLLASRDVSSIREALLRLTWERSEGNATRRSRAGCVFSTVYALLCVVEGATNPKVAVEDMLMYRMRMIDAEHGSEEDRRAFMVSAYADILAIIERIGVPASMA